MGKLSFEGTKFVFGSLDSDELNAAKHAGFKFEGTEPVSMYSIFSTRKIEKAVALRGFADKSAEDKFKEHYITKFKAPDNIEFPDRLTPKVFQIQTAWHLTTRSPTYCALEAGLGKTIVSSLCMNSVPGKVLIICPPFLKFNWKIEVNKWAPSHKVFIYGYDGEDVFESATCYIVPDSLVARIETQTLIRQKMGALRWMFVDEAHRFKDENAQRTQALTRHLKFVAERTVFLSGTPIPNKAMELYPLLNAFAPWSIGYRTRSEFGQAFCNPIAKEMWGAGRQRSIVYEYNGISNGEKLGAELRKDFMIRFTKREVLRDLSPKIRQIIYSEEPKYLRKYEQSILKRYSLQELMGRGDDGNDSAQLGDIATYRRESGLSMVAPAIEIIRDFLNENPDECMVVAAHHVEVVERIYEALFKFNPVLIRGGTTSKIRQAQVMMFQNNKNHRVVVGNIDAMGVGLTLTRAKRGLTVEPSWTPGVNEQMEDRIHRITQTGDVVWQYLLGHKSLNERMLFQIMKKQKGIDTVMS